MMEFFFSKFWGMVCGLLVVSVLCSVLSSVSNYEQKKDDNQFLDGLVRQISTVSRSQSPLHIRIPLNELEEGEMLVIREDSISFIEPGQVRIRHLGSGVRLMISGQKPLPAGGALSMSNTSNLVLENKLIDGIWTTLVYEEKASTSFSTDVTKRAQSSSVLYT